MSKRDIKLYINDIIDSIEKIENYTSDIDFSTFSQDTKTLDAVVRNISIIGEATSNLPDEIKSKYPEVPWKEIVGTRNKTIHEYFGIDEEILWKTIKADLPPFKKQISEILKTYS